MGLATAWLRNPWEKETSDFLTFFSTKENKLKIWHLLCREGH